MKRGAIIGVAATAAAVLLVGAGLAWALTRPPSAEDAAHAYLDALSDGDFATIDSMRGMRLDDEQERILADAFAGAESFVSETRIEELSTREGLTSVRASAQLAGDRRDLHFVLGQESGRWVLSGDYLASLEVLPRLSGTESPAGDAVWIGAALAPAGTRVALLPAEYQLEAAPRGLLAGGSSVALSNDVPATVTIEASIASEATAVAQAHIDDYADVCTAPAVSVPADCGLRVPWAADLAALSSIAFRIDQRPMLTLSPDARTFAATGGVVIATATGTTRDGGTASFTYRADDWALRGAVSFLGNEMVLAVG